MTKIIENLTEWEMYQKDVRDGKLSLREFRNMRARIIYSKILRETDKAIEIEIEFLRRKRSVWLPKSQISIIDRKIYVPLWLIDSKGLRIPR